MPKRRPRRLPPTPHGRCCLCHRELKDGAPVVAGFGLVGPECRKGLEVLAHLRDLVQDVPFGPLDAAGRDALNTAIIDLRMMGFDVVILDTDAGKVASVRGPAKGQDPKRVYERLVAHTARLRGLARAYAPHKLTGEAAAA